MRITSRRASIKYADNVDYILASTLYLAIHSSYWARSPASLAEEISLDPYRLLTVFEGFPGLYRRSIKPSPSGQYYYALQARYAQREGMETREPGEEHYIKPLDSEGIKLLIDFVLKSVEQERVNRRSMWTNFIAVGAAIVAATAAVSSAFLKHGSS